MYFLSFLYFRCFVLLPALCYLVHLSPNNDYKDGSHSKTKLQSTLQTNKQTEGLKYNTCMSGNLTKIWFLVSPWLYLLYNRANLMKSLLLLLKMYIKVQYHMKMWNLQEEKKTWHTWKHDFHNEIVKIQNRNKHRKNMWTYFINLNSSVYAIMLHYILHDI